MGQKMYTGYFRWLRRTRKLAIDANLAIFGGRLYVGERWNDYKKLHFPAGGRQSLS